MRGPGGLLRIVLAAGSLYPIATAHAEDLTPLCESMAAAATAKAPRTAMDIGAWADLMTEALPPGMRELKPETPSPEQLAGLLGCDSSTACPVAGDTTAENFFEYPNDSAWRTLAVDTRPEGDTLFVFTDHSGHDRCDSINAFVQSGGDWSVSPFAFGETTAICDDSGYAILEAGKRAYVAIPPGRASFIDMVPFAAGAPGEPDKIAMSVFDPKSNSACSVYYRLAPSVILSFRGFFHVVAGQQGDSLAAFFTKAAGGILKKTAFDQKVPRTLLYRGDDFIQPGTDAGELRKVHDFLASPDASTETAIAALQDAGMQEYFGPNDDTANPGNWTSRLLTVGVDGHAYAAVLLQYDGPGFFFMGPHFFQAAVMVLFGTDGKRLTPVAYFDVENSYRFQKADAESGAADR